MERDDRLLRLSREHTQALLLALRIERELPTASDQQVARLYADLIGFWSAGLLPHFRAESECLLARLLRHRSDDDPQLRRLQTDHLRLEALVATMRDEDGVEPRREALAAFGTRLREHVRWEERQLFEAVEQALSEAELDALGADLAERLPEHPLPAPLGDGGLARRG